MNRFIEFYRTLFETNKTWLKTALALFLFSGLIGLVTFFIKPELLEVIVQGFQDKFGANPPLDFDLVIQIFLQNLLATSIALFGGIVLGITSLVVILVNGFLLGFIVASIFFIPQGNLLISLGLLVGGILPHGVFEVPAFMIAATLGLRWGIDWLRKDSKGKRLQVWKNNLIQVVTIFPLIAIALFIAAWIEVFVSGKIVDKF